MAKLQLRVLYREFLFRVIDLELLAPQGDISKLLGQFAALLLFVGLWVLLPAVIMTDGPPSELSLLLTWTTEHFIIATTMLVVGLFAVLSWESMFPDRRDVMVLAPLPVRTRTLFLAKVAAITTALSLAVFALIFFPAYWRHLLSRPHRRCRRLTTSPRWLRYTRPACSPCWIAIWLLRGYS